MIKLNKFIYIHITTIFLFILCYLNRNLEILIISYISILIHEFAHLIAASVIGLKASRIVLYPFGVNLKLKNTIIYSISDEIILYLSGPIINALISVLIIILNKNGNLWEELYWNNLMLFLFNLLPIVPMDGGIILKKIIVRKIGYNSSIIILNCISTVLITILIIIEIYLIRISKLNFSIIFICIFLLGNIFTNKEKYNINYIKEIMYYKQKNNFKIKKAKCIMIKSNINYNELVKRFSQGNTYIIFKEDKTGKISEILTEKEIVEDLLK